MDYWLKTRRDLLWMMGYSMGIQYWGRTTSDSGCFI